MHDKTYNYGILQDVVRITTYPIIRWFAGIPMPRHSLVHRVGAVVIAIILVALINIAVSLTISASIQGSATAINQAGAMRMQSYILLTDWLMASNRLPPTQESARLAEVLRFSQRLADPAIVSTLPSDQKHPLTHQLSEVTQHWYGQVLPLLTAKPTPGKAPELRQYTDTFVSNINTLVTLLEQRTEARIRLMNLVQVTSLVFATLIVILMLFDIKNRVITPLRRLLDIARAVGSKDFSQRARLRGADELSQLGRAFDQMTAALAVSYSQLETEATTKARQLKRSNTALELLHNASRKLFASDDLCVGAIPLLQELEELLSIGPIRLYLHDKHAPKRVEAMSTATTERPFYCKDHHCNACLVSPEAFDSLPSVSNDGRRLLLPILAANQLLGTLEIWYPKHLGLPSESRRFLETLSDQLATAIFLKNQMTEQQQLTLAEERAVIARELHDSLAQSLSYLKMQVARLRRLDLRGNPDQSHGQLHDDILNELSTGLSSAYRQLRELLTTFRLKLDTPGLGSALKQTADEFNKRLPNPIQLTYSLPAQILSPNEEIHVLQIVREALANVAKHANATQVSVAIEFNSPQIQVRVRDNGIGLPDTKTPSQHYGLIIIQDRTRTLGGKVTVSNQPAGGVEVSLTFVPKSRHLIAAQASASSG